MGLTMLHFFGLSVSLPKEAINNLSEFIFIFRGHTSISRDNTCINLVGFFFGLRKEGSTAGPTAWSTNNGFLCFLLTLFLWGFDGVEPVGR